MKRSVFAVIRKATVGLQRQRRLHATLGIAQALMALGVGMWAHGISSAGLGTASGLLVLLVAFSFVRVGRLSRAITEHQVYTACLRTTSDPRAAVDAALFFRRQREQGR